MEIGDRVLVRDSEGDTIELTIELLTPPSWRGPYVTLGETTVPHEKPKVIGVDAKTGDRYRISEDGRTFTRFGDRRVLTLVST